MRYSGRQDDAISRKPAHFTLHFDVLLHNHLNFNDSKKICYAVIAHFAFLAYLKTYLLIFYANFQRFISIGWCSKFERMTVLSIKKHSTSIIWTHCLFWHVNSLKQTIYILRKLPFFWTEDLILIVKSDIIIIVMNTDKKISFFYLKFTETRKIYAF